MHPLNASRTLGGILTKVVLFSSSLRVMTFPGSGLALVFIERGNSSHGDRIDILTICYKYCQSDSFSLVFPNTS